MYKGGDSMEIKTEADSNECSHDDKPVKLQLTNQHRVDKPVCCF